MNKDYQNPEIYFLTTPFEKVKAQMKMRQGDKPCLVLLATISDATVHYGFINLMEEKKKEAEEKGWHIIGGYFAPIRGNLPLSQIEQLIYELEMLVYQSDWLYVDTWAALYAPQENDVLAIKTRLKEYLTEHLKIECPVQVYHLNHETVKFCPFEIECDPQPDEGEYAIRNDLVKALPISRSQTEKAISGIKEAFFRAFDGQMNMRILEVMDQEEKSMSIVREKRLPTISMDVFIRGDYNLDISRQFDMATLQYRSNKLIHRPNTLPLEQQVQLIPPGKYLLIEDDMPTGQNTMKRVKQLFEGRIVIEQMLILSDLHEEERNRVFFDIVDMRDFIFGAKHGGLVVSLPNGKSVRAPYVLPYVSPISRARIPAGKALIFSQMVLEVNRKFFEENPMYLYQMDKSFISLMQYVGFKSHDEMSSIVKWHQAKILR
ncbi:hypothetical protein NDS46_30145 (plasmid) [Paenibacillus thiaminolyticus]|uniref:hypothetical protein n=1 Tax=Paenibacillus thiaminolyticus TaxID=49283 RepID=UPI002330DC46|nr:hypothetical protein [Paenibacillus thiaminolyticus]WCF11609.1 hypothetical protein NDS46_30145 [Paenibacillus thiaminolyticus]